MRVIQNLLYAALLTVVTACANPQPLIKSSSITCQYLEGNRIDHGVTRGCVGTLVDDFFIDLTETIQDETRQQVYFRLSTQGPERNSIFYEGIAYFHEPCAQEELRDCFSEIEDLDAEDVTLRMEFGDAESYLSLRDLILRTAGISTPTNSSHLAH